MGHWALTTAVTAPGNAGTSLKCRVKLRQKYIKKKGIFLNTCFFWV